MEAIKRIVVDSPLMPLLNEQRLHGWHCDFCLVSENGQIFSAHKNILAARSIYFNRMFGSAFPDASNSTINLQERGEVVEEILSYIYTGTVQVLGENAVELLHVADKYLFPSLFVAVQGYIAQNIDTKNCVSLLALSRTLNAAILSKAAVKFVVDNVETVNFGGIENDDMIILISDKNLRHEDNFVQKFIKWSTSSIDSLNATRMFIELLEFGKLSEDSLNIIHTIFSKNTNFSDLISTKLLCLTNSLRAEYEVPLTQIVQSLGIQADELHTIVNEEEDAVSSFTFEKITEGFVIRQEQGYETKCFLSIGYNASGESLYVHVVHDFRECRARCFIPMPSDAYVDDIKIYRVGLTGRGDVPNRSRATKYFGDTYLFNSNEPQPLIAREEGEGGVEEEDSDRREVFCIKWNEYEEKVTVTRLKDIGVRGRFIFFFTSENNKKVVLAEREFSALNYPVSIRVNIRPNVDYIIYIFQVIDG